MPSSKTSLKGHVIYNSGSTAFVEIENPQGSWTSGHWADAHFLLPALQKKTYKLIRQGSWDKCTVITRTSMLVRFQWIFVAWNLVKVWRQILGTPVFHAGRRCCGTGSFPSGIRIHERIRSPKQLKKNLKEQWNQEDHLKVCKTKTKTKPALKCLYQPCQEARSPNHRQYKENASLKTWKSSTEELWRENFKFRH